VSKGSRSWGHAMRPLTEDEKQLRARQGWTCTRPRCREAATHQTTYSYVSGRGGRVTSADRPVCAPHAAAFATRYGLPSEAGEAQ
jgi:hypothetical protein